MASSVVGSSTLQMRGVDAAASSHGDYPVLDYLWPPPLYPPTIPSTIINSPDGLVDGFLQQYIFFFIR